MHSRTSYGPYLALALLELAIIWLAWGDEIEAFVASLTWNVQVGIFGILAAALGLAAVAALTWRPK